MQVGILALQGAIEPHLRKLKRLGVDTLEVRRERDLAGLCGIILPGGESSTMLRLLATNDLLDPLTRFIAHTPTWGLCAGAILLAKTVENPAQPSIGAIDVTITRNAYGRQLESFIDTIRPTAQWADTQVREGVFIRAPRIGTLGPLCETLFYWHNDPVVVKSSHILLTTFHPELSEPDTFHEFFLGMCR